MFIKVKSRYSASAIHFALSLSIFLIFIAVLLFFWFPEPFFTAGGGWQGLKLVTLVDLVLGPLLTLVIFDPKKSRKALASDIGIIALCQITALIWGIYNVYQQRPLVMAFFKGSFYTVPALDLRKQQFDYKDYGPKPPVIAYVEAPTSVKDKQYMVRKIQEQGLPPFSQINLYRPIENGLAELSKNQLILQKVKQKRPEAHARLVNLLDDLKLEDSQVRIFILQAKYQELALVLSQDLDYLGAVKL